MGARNPTTGLPTQKASPTKTLLLPGVCLVGSWTLGVTLWRTTGFIQPLLLFGYIGTVLGVGLGLYALLSGNKKQRGRRLTLLGVGGGLLAFMGIVQSENLQIEWLVVAHHPRARPAEEGEEQIRGDMTRCNECEACEKMCPMDIRILDYLREGERVLSTECMLCQT